MTHAIEPAEDTLDASNLIEDPQVAMSLVRQCAGFCQLVRALRTTPPQCLQRVCEHLDNSLLSTTEEIHVLCPLNTPARAQIQRLKRHGGFVLRSSERKFSNFSIRSAFIGNILFCKLRSICCVRSKQRRVKSTGRGKSKGEKVREKEGKSGKLFLFA